MSNTNTISLIGMRFGGLMAALLAGSALAEERAHWGYEGEHGPAHWASISSEFSACAGKNQSPIDLVTVRMIEAELEDIALSYQAVPLDVINNGHTIQVNIAPGSHLVVDEIQFELTQFHFHSPSENHIDGQSFPMEAHLVHVDVDGHLAVVAVMFQEGDENSFLSNIWANLPHEAGGVATAAGTRVNAENLLPENRDYYRFNGSLTTPPCSEGVRWLVCKNPVEISTEQVAAFKQVVHHDNNRPVQAINARPVLK